MGVGMGGWRMVSSTLSPSLATRGILGIVFFFGCVCWLGDWVGILCFVLCGFGLGWGR